MNSSFNEHQSIVDAIIKGDSERATALLRAHVTVQGERFADLVATLRDFNAGDLKRSADQAVKHLAGKKGEKGTKRAL